MPDWGIAIQRFCGNCGTRMIGYKSKDDLIRMQCPACGTVAVAKKVGRKHLRVEEHRSKTIEVEQRR